jgi:ATP-dependent DNA helicase RecG
MSILDKHMKKDIANLLLDKLSGVLDKKQKQNKIRNIVYTMSKKDQTIELVGSSQTGFWVLKEK